MTNSPGMPTTNDPTVANPTGPDWSLVPFDVPCGRCGEDLRGLTDPTCPACKFRFDWSDAVPIAHLKCQKCGYALMGLTTCRCPECGTAFTWEGALDAHYRRKHLLFEYHWREKPVRSFIRTAFLMFRPRLLWQQLDIHDRPRVQPLIVMVAVAHGITAVLLPLVLVLFVWQHYGPIEMNTSGSGIANKYLYDLWAMYTNPRVYLMALILAIWSSLVFGSLLILRQFMKRHRAGSIRALHVLRVWAHCVPVPASLASLAAVTVTTIIFSTVADPYPHFDTAIGWIPVAANLCTCFLLQKGCQRYLKMPYAWGIAVATHAVGVLGAVVVVRLVSF